MKRVDASPIATEAEYDSALTEIEAYFENEPKPGTIACDRFDMLARAIEAWEDKHWAIEPPEAAHRGRLRRTALHRLPGRTI